MLNPHLQAIAALISFCVVPTEALAMGTPRPGAPSRMDPAWPPPPQSAIVVPVSLDPEAASEGNEKILQIAYSMECMGEPFFSGMTGTLAVGDERVRVDLFSARNRVETSLGPAALTHLELELDPNPGCRLLELEARATAASAEDHSNPDDLDSLALRHSPFLHVREDQFTNRYTDLPLKLSYRVHLHPRRGTRILEYVLYLSDEDSRSSPRSASRSVGDYGRSSDIEWLYRVELDAGGGVLRRQYQSSGRILAKAVPFGHSTRRFDGSSIGDHPLLYLHYKNNTFADEPVRRRRPEDPPHPSYRLVPRERLEVSEAIELGLLRDPWMFAVTEAEQMAEGKPVPPAPDHLFVLLEGSLRGQGPGGAVTGAFRLRLDLEDAQGLRSRHLTGGHGIERSWINGDAWLRSSLLAAIPVGREQIQKLVEGSSRASLRLVTQGELRPRLDLRGIRVFRITPDYRTEELSGDWICTVAGMGSRCRR